MTRPDDDTPDPRERDLSRRSQTSSVGIWLIIALILMGGALVYFLSAL